MATTPSTASAHDACERDSRKPPASRQTTPGLASSSDEFKNRSALTPGTDRVAALATPARKGVAAAQEYRRQASLTPRQAAISARKQAEEQKRRDAVLLRRQREEMKNAAKANRAALLAHQQQTLRERAGTAQRQRKAAAAAKKAAHERETAAKAKELQAKMRESREVQECLSREAREKRRDNIAYKSAAWAKERELKKKLQEARQQEEKMLMEGLNVFLEAKQRVREQRELTDKQERAWRAKAKKSEETLKRRQGALATHEAHRIRRDQDLDQAALEKEAAEEKRLRRASAQWRRNEKALESVMKRSPAEGTLDAPRLAEVVCLRDDDRKARERDLVNARKAEEEYRRLEHFGRRLYRQEEDMRRKEQEARERRVMLEDRTSVLEGKRKEEEEELDRREALREVPPEKTKLEILEDIWSRQAHPAAAAAARGRLRLRLEEAEELASFEATVSPEARTSGESGGPGRVFSESNGGCGGGGSGGFHSERDGSMSNGSNSSGGFDILGRLSVRSPEAHTSGESGGVGRVSSEVNGGCEPGEGDGFYRERTISDSSSGSSSVFRIPGRLSAHSSLDSLILECIERRIREGNGSVMSMFPSRSDASVVEARGVAAGASAVLAVAKRSFDSVKNPDPAGAAAMASTTAENWSPSGGCGHDHDEPGCFPVRALVFPETHTEGEAPREEAQAEAEAEHGVRGLAVDGP